MAEPLLSVVVPLLNERPLLAKVLPRLRHWQMAYPDIEWLFVDGGSRDGSADYLREQGMRLIVSEPGRARQMNAGAAVASGCYLLFLHIDTELNRPAIDVLLNICRRGRAQWGRFDVRLTGRPRLLPVISMLMNQRSRLTGIATGDMGIFVQRGLFSEQGGYAPQPLMEDIELSRRLRTLSRPLCLRQVVASSGRRWEQQGCVRTILLMWWLRLQYFFGVPAERLLRSYYPEQREPQ